MNHNIKSLQKALKNRKAELQRLITQMQTDELNKSKVFRNLNDELGRVEGKLKASQQK